MGRRKNNPSLVSRLFADLLAADEIEVVSEPNNFKRVYRRKK